MYMYTIRVEQLALKVSRIGQKFQLMIFEIKGILAFCII